MSKPTPLSGFPELLPEQRFVEQQVIDTLRRTFELHGFAGIETRAVEPMDQLLRKGETSKEVYVLRRLQEEAEGKDSGMGLHFDLTVPFARYVLENAGKLEFPFRRYQIQKAWRGERPQEGRYREFTQADIDVVMKDELPFHFDVEVARVMAEALSGLPLPPLRLRVNNRKLIEGFYRRTRRPSSPSSTSSTRCPPSRSPSCWSTTRGSAGTRPTSAWRWRRSPRPTPASSSRCGRWA
jgi:histidyl-tRNA synthetase